MPNRYTTAEAAAALNVTERRVRQLAKELGLPKFGSQYELTDKDVRRMDARKTARGPEKKAKK